MLLLLCTVALRIVLIVLQGKTKAGHAHTRKPDVQSMFKNSDYDTGTSTGTMMVKDSGTMMVKDSPTGKMMVKTDATMGGALTAAAMAMRPSAGVGQSVAPTPANPEVCP